MQGLKWATTSSQSSLSTGPLYLFLKCPNPLSSGCHDCKCGDLGQRKLISLTVLKARNPKPDCGQGHASPKACRRGTLPHPPASGSPRCPGPRGPRQPNFHLLPLCSHGLLLMCVLPSCKGNNRTELKAYSNSV